MNYISFFIRSGCLFSLVAMNVFACAASSKEKTILEADTFQKDFDVGKCNMLTEGKNDYFILIPGHKVVLEGGKTKVEIEVTDKTKIVDGINTRVVVEKEWKEGNLYEVAANYFAICEQTSDVYYFGEDVDFYKNNKVINHDGAWLAGVEGSKAGLFMPGKIKPKMKYYHEVAPGVAMDRAEIVSSSETCKTPAGTFEQCLKVKEQNPMERGSEEYKYYAPGVGLIQDDELVLTHYSQ